MALTSEDIKNLASLTRLELGEEESERLRGQMEAVLEYVNRLAEIDTVGIPEAEMPREVFTGRQDVLVVQDASIRELILENFPDSVASALKVPAVFDKPKG